MENIFAAASFMRFAPSLDTALNVHEVTQSVARLDSDYRVLHYTHGKREPHGIPYGKCPERDSSDHLNVPKLPFSAASSDVV